MHFSFRPGADVQCHACGRGRVNSYRWVPPETLRAFVVTQVLRNGKLYECSSCRKPWYLDRAHGWLNAIEPKQASVLLEWSSQKVVVPAPLREILNEIGGTPPYYYGHVNDDRAYPCGVVTRAGERMDIAIVRVSGDFPFWCRTARLVKEIAGIYPSPFALPLDIRVATANARETRMGLAPTPIEMPDGRYFVLNYSPEFLVCPGYAAADARLADAVPSGITPEIINSPEGLTYFLAHE